MKEQKDKTKYSLRYKQIIQCIIPAARLFTIIFLIMFSIMLFAVSFTFHVSGTSMYPTLEHAQPLIVWRLNYTPAQGDIVIVDISDLRDESEDIVKRVIATEGQTVDIDYDTNTVYVDGVALAEDYINNNDGDTDYDVMMETTDMVYNHVTVPEGCIFVMGDNRNYSLDSRFEEIGFIDVEDVIGKVVAAM